MLDIDFGTFPYVTSSTTITAGVCNGLGIAPQQIREVMGVTKAYCTRVGSGPFPTELEDATGEELRKTGHEFGATTGRPRRCGWIDLVALQYACMINGVTRIIMTKADVLDKFPALKLCTAYRSEGKEMNFVPFQMERIRPEPVYKEFPGWNTSIEAANSLEGLPDAMKTYIGFINDYLGIPIRYISNGPGRDQIIRL
jgi:adenylosuccinate synthase